MKACLLLTVLACAAMAQTAEEITSACKQIDGKVLNLAGDSQATLPRTFESGLCWGAFMLVGLAVHSDLQPIFHVCMPQGVTRTQAISIFLAFTQRNPQRLHEPFERVVIDSLREAFPCQAKRAP